MINEWERCGLDRLSRNGHLFAQALAQTQHANAYAGGRKTAFTPDFLGGIAFQTLFQQSTVALSWMAQVWALPAVIAVAVRPRPSSTGPTTAGDSSSPMLFWLP